MSKHETIETPELTDGEIHWSAALRALNAAMDAASKIRGGQRMLGEAMSAYLDTFGAGAPSYEAFGKTREDADWWADTATPQELEVYTGASLRRIERTTFALKAKKRIFWMLWKALPKADQDAFKSAIRGPENK